MVDIRPAVFSSSELFTRYQNTIQNIKHVQIYCCTFSILKAADSKVRRYIKKKKKTQTIHVKYMFTLKLNEYL